MHDYILQAQQRERVVCGVSGVCKIYSFTFNMIVCICVRDPKNNCVPLLCTTNYFTHTHAAEAAGRERSVCGVSGVFCLCVTLWWWFFAEMLRVRDSKN